MTERANRETAGSIRRVLSLSIRIVDRFREKRLRRAGTFNWHRRNTVHLLSSLFPLSLSFSLDENKRRSGSGKFISRILMNSKCAIIDA